MKRLHVYFAGRVQGVAFRYYVETQARRLAVKGWVRNLPDGRVELLAEGPEPVLQELLQECRKGPPLALVTDVKVEWSEATGEFPGFQIRY